MNLLVDTNALLWWLLGARRLSRAARDAITTADIAFVSAVTIWEVSIKQAMGWLEVPVDLAERSLAEGFQPLAIDWEHGRVAGGLPPHHRDPFDRMLVAQAIVERLTIVTGDETLARYGVPVVRA